MIKTMEKKPCIILTGPTGVGKTEFIQAISKALNNKIEVINADVGQFYEPLSIGTAKPDWRNEKELQHLFDRVKEPLNYTAFEYKHEVASLLNSIWSRNAIPVIVGGSGFYIKSLFFTPQENVFSNQLAKKSIEDYLYNKTTQDLFDELNAVDSKRAQMLHPHDRYRIERALILWYGFGIKPSDQTPTFSPICDNYYMIFLTRPRVELYKRINQRVIEMIKNGWIEEVGNLPCEWQSFLKHKKLIGYDDIINFLKTNNSSLDRALSAVPMKILIETIQQKTRWYAKRQCTFWNSLKKQLERCSKTCDTQGTIKEIILTDNIISNADTIYSSSTEDILEGLVL